MGVTARVAAEPIGTAAALLELTKWRLNTLVLATVAAGAALAGGAAWPALVAAGAGAALCAFGACAWNQVLEREHDARMARTRDRPLPSGRLSARSAALFATALLAAGEAVLLAGCGPAAAAVAAATALLYAPLYTSLKRVTPLAFVPGALAGAAPPLIGWAAVTGDLGPGGWVIPAIVLAWQAPHVAAIDWRHRDDARRGGLRTPAAIDPSGRLSAAQALAGGAALVLALLLPALLGLRGPATVAAALLVSGPYVARSVAFARAPTDASARALFRASLVHLPVVLLLLALAD